MPQVRINPGRSSERVFVYVGDWPSTDAVVRAHGYDPNTTDYEVDDPDQDLRDAIQAASNLQELKAALTSDDHPARARRGQR